MSAEDRAAERWRPAPAPSEPFTDARGQVWVVLPGAGSDKPSREEVLSMARLSSSAVERRVLGERRALLSQRRGGEAEIARIDALLAIEPTPLVPEEESL